MTALAPPSSIGTASTDLKPVVVRAETDGEEWDAFIASHAAGTVEHLWTWRGIFSDVFRQRPLYLTARRGDQIVGALPLVAFSSSLFGHSVVSLPYANYAGLVTSDTEAARALIEEAHKHAESFDATHVELRNVERHTRDLPVRMHKVGARLSLPPTADELWKQIDRKIRNQVRKAQKEKLDVMVGGAELLDPFYRVFSQNMRDLGTPVFPRSLFEQVAQRFSQAARVFIVNAQGVPVAGAIGLAWRNVFLVPWASSLREYRHLCPNMLLYWSMLEHAITSGYHTFDFGRSTQGGGTHQFKEQWGATSFPLHWEYLMLRDSEPPDHGTSNVRMALFIRAWQRLPLPVANVLGPHVIRHIA